MNKPLLLFVGPSGSGKTSVANMFEEKLGFKQLQSYTTREKRSEDEIGHIFVTNEEFSKLENIVAYTVYNGNHYCATEEQVDSVDIYVVDVAGVRTLLSKYSNKERQIIIIYFDCDVMNRIRRMAERGDSDSEIIRRILNDDNADKEVLHMLSYNEQNCSNRNCQLYSVNANCDMDSVFKQVMQHVLGGVNNDYCS